MNTDKLIKLKEEIAQSKSEITRLKGQIDLLISQLKDQYGCTTIAEAKALVKKFEEEAADLTEKIEKGKNELDSKLSDL